MIAVPFVTSEAVLSRSPSWRRVFWGCKCQLRFGGAKALAGDVHRAWRWTYRTATVVAAVRVPLCNERLSAGLLFHGSLLCCGRLYGGLLLGNRPFFGGALPLSDDPCFDAPCSDGDDPIFDDVLVLCYDASEVLVCMSRVGGVVVLEFS